MRTTLGLVTMLALGSVGIGSLGASTAIDCAWMTPSTQNVRTFYIWGADLWEETNGFPGLQTGSCESGSKRFTRDQCIVIGNAVAPDATINCSFEWLDGRGL